MWTTLNLNGKSKMKKKNGNGDICRGALDIEFQRAWSVGLVATLGDDHTEKLFIFSVSGNLLGKVDSVILLGFECTRNPQNVIKFVEAISEKIEILIFFLRKLSLIWRVGRKQKYGVEIFSRGIYMSNLNEIDQLV